jgi:EAL domain-containing protein (putative c-di-GMP-specific phosphodiesterase class I)
MGAQAVRLSNIDIDNALKNKDFEVLFQPIFDLGNGALARMETFVRWRHASLGVLPPGAFISFFESQGRMGELTRYVLCEALDRYIAWRGRSAPGFSINLALSDLADGAFCSHFRVLLRDRGFPADLITLECPMPPVTMPMDAASAQFARLSDVGARLAIEVRGRANDFLRTIEPFPFDEIKTGGAAILRFARTVRGPGLSAISELLEIAQKTNAVITAVGVEDQASLSALRGLGFAAAQGNHLGKVGDLSSFVPAKVNEVRGLLALDPLSTADLHALFRTEAPALVHAEPAAAPAADPLPAPAAEADALVERLAARIARQSTSETAQPIAEAPAAPPRAALKAAAIARAKRKAQAGRAPRTTEDRVDSASETAAARELQQRLSREFDAMAAGGLEQAAPAPADEFEFAAPQPVRHDLDSPAVEGLEPPTQAASADTAKFAGVGAGLEPAREADEEASISAPEEHGEASEAAGVAQGAPERRSLAISGARAYFRPGVRVGITRRAGKKAPVAAPTSKPAQPKLRERDLFRQFAEMKAADAAASAARDASPATLEGDLARPDAPAPEPAAVEDAGAVPATTRKRRKKSFLSRTVVRLSPHFWPASWRRSWARRKSSAARSIDAAPAQQTE